MIKKRSSNVIYMKSLLLESQIKMERRAVDSSLISHITPHQVKENENENRILQVSLDAGIMVSENGSITSLFPVA